MAAGDYGGQDPRHRDVRAGPGRRGGQALGPRVRGDARAAGAHAAAGGAAHAGAVQHRHAVRLSPSHLSN